MKVLIAGSHGFIGGYLSHFFADKGWEVIGVDKVTLYKPAQYELFLKHYEIREKTQLKGLKAFYRLDCCYGAQLARIIQKHKPDIIINLASVSAADVCKKNTEEAVESIYQLNANMLETIKDYKNLQRYVFISSSMVYGDFQSEKPDEEVPKFPKDPYGATKLGAEFLIQAFQHQFNISFSIVRPSAVYGPLDSNMRVTGIFMRNAHLGKPLKINDVNERLDFTYVDDVVQGIFLAATHPKAENQVFNITRGEGRTILEFAQEIIKHYPNVKIEIGDQSEHMEGLVRPMRGALGIDKAKKLLGYRPKYSIAKGVEKYVREWKKIYGDTSSSSL